MTHEIAVDLVGRGTCSPMRRTNSKEAFILSDVSLTSYGYEPSTLLLIMVIAVFSYLAERCKHLLFTMRLIWLIFCCRSCMNSAEKVLGDFGTSIGLLRAHMR